MLFELIDHRLTLSVGMPVDTRPIHCDRQSLVYRSAIGDIGVLLTCLAEIAAVSLPAKDAKQEPITCSWVDRARMQLNMLSFQKHIGFWYNCTLFLPHGWVFHF